jgi:hypothetical protein
MKHLGPLVLVLLVACGSPAVRAQPCCGPIAAEGQRLAVFLDGTGVDHLWLAGRHVDWRTGETDRAQPGGPDAKTHCSAFVAAVADRLGVYVLRPPEHPQSLLANAQIGWLAQQGRSYGWHPVGDALSAQQLANTGALVLAAVANPDPDRPGHIVVLRPSLKSAPELIADGPQEAQAGETNALSTTIAAGFRHHRGAWQPGGGGAIRYYAHAVDWSRVAPPGDRGGAPAR